jgi:adenine phosphoribosyltransferase
MSAESVDEQDLQLVNAAIRLYPDYPQPGILFRDIFPVFADARLAERLFALMHRHLQRTQGDNSIDVIAGLEARGFLFGPVLAARLGCAFVPIRKRGKLPGVVRSVKYVKEYGVDEFEIQADALKTGQRVVLVDDLMATGGTFVAGKQLVEQLGATVVDCLCVIELIELGARRVLEPTRVSSLLKY